MTEPVVTLELPGGMPTVLGRDSFPGYPPVDVSVVSDGTGFATCSFALRRPRSAYMAPQPDLSAWAPCVVEEAGKVTFEGRVMEAPIQPDEGLIQVQGRGWQYNLDDDVFERLWAHSSLGDGWRDSRELPGTDLDIYRSAGATSVGEGSISLGFPKGADVENNVRVGVTFDAGTELAVARVVYRGDGRNDHTANVGLRIIGTDTPSPHDAGAETVLTNDPGAANPYDTGPTGATFSTPRRYVHVYLVNTGGDAAALAEEVYLRIAELALYRSASYESGGASAFKASQALKDALDFAPELSPDRTGIEDTLLSLRHFSTSAPATPRAVKDAANAFHGYRFKVGQGRRARFGPFPTVPKWQVTAPAARRLVDASEVSADPMYNCVLVESTDESGAPLRVRRYTGALPEHLAGAERPGDVAFPNPSFDVDDSDWTALSGTLQRTTGTFDSAPAGGQNPFGTLIAETTLTGTFKRGVVYVVQLMVRKNSSGTGTGRTELRFGVLNAGDPLAPVGPDWAFAQRYVETGGVFTPITVAWAPSADRTGVKLHLLTQGQGHFDTATLFTPKPTLLDRRGYVRTYQLSVSFPITLPIAEAVSDAFLRLHQRAPFKAELAIQPGDLLTYPEGVPAHPRELVCEEGELVHFPGLVDPNTAARGRDGVIAQVQYGSDEGVARTSIDNQRDNLEALLARYALLTGQG